MDNTTTVAIVTLSIVFGVPLLMIIYSGIKYMVIQSETKFGQRYRSSRGITYVPHGIRILHWAKHQLTGVIFCMCVAILLYLIAMAVLSLIFFSKDSFISNVKSCLTPAIIGAVMFLINQDDILRRVRNIKLFAGERHIGKIGDKGEKLVRKELRLVKKLMNGQCVIMNNVLLKNDYPGKSKTTQIDHILISPSGVFVIETKHYTGLVIASNEAQWKHFYIKGKSKELPSPTRQNYGHASLVSSILGQNFYGKVKSIVAVVSEECNVQNAADNVVEYMALTRYINNYINPNAMPDWKIAAKILQKANIKGAIPRLMHRFRLQRMYGNTAKGGLIETRSSFGDNANNRYSRANGHIYN